MNKAYLGKWLAALAFVPLVLLAVLLMADTRKEDPTCSAYFRKGETLQNRCGLAVDAGAKRTALRMQASLSRGALAWSLEDPRGVIRWQGRAAAGQPLDAAWSVTNPLPGRWILHIKLSGAVGEYSAPWVSH